MPACLPLIIRPAVEADLPSLVTYSAAMAWETEGRRLDPGRLREGTAALLASAQHGQFLVAETPHEGRPTVIAQLMITYEWSDWRNGQFWWIQSVYVAPLFRRQGVYRRLHEEVLRLAKNQGNVCGVRLYVERSNQVAQSVYRRVGLAHSAYDVFEVDFVCGHTPSSTSAHHGD